MLDRKKWTATILWKQYDHWRCCSIMSICLKNHVKFNQAGITNSLKLRQVYDISATFWVTLLHCRAILFKVNVFQQVDTLQIPNWGVLTRWLCYMRINGIVWTSFNFNQIYLECKRSNKNNTESENKKQTSFIQHTHNPVEINNHINNSLNNVKSTKPTTTKKIKRIKSSAKYFYTNDGKHYSISVITSQIYKEQNQALNTF